MKLGDEMNSGHLVHCRHHWETELEEGYEHAVNDADLSNDLSLSLAVTLSLMRGMQDTIDEMRSRLAAVEKRR